MTRTADLIYYTRPRPPRQRFRFILGDGSIKKFQLIEKIDLVFHSRTDFPLTLCGGSFVPDLGSNLFFLHVV